MEIPPNNLRIFDELSVNLLIYALSLLIIENAGAKSMMKVWIVFGFLFTISILNGNIGILFITISVLNSFDTLFTNDKSIVNSVSLSLTNLTSIFCGNWLSFLFNIESHNISNPEGGNNTSITIFKGVLLIKTRYVFMGNWLSFLINIESHNISNPEGGNNTDYYI